MRIIHVPIESYPQRYTADWTKQFEEAFCELGVESITVPGDRLTEQIVEGSVLDACGTNYYKFAQLKRLIQMISNGAITSDDVILFADAWFPGLESLFYIRNITKVNFKIAGILHAGTWDPHDFTARTGMRAWGQYSELGWLYGMDIIFVATQWHKDLIVMNSGYFDRNKICVTGLPFYSEKLTTKYPIRPKEDIVVFPHRPDIEKHPEKFDRLSKKYPQWRFIKTMEVTRSREEYFNLLARSRVMVSFAEQETFGYATLESMALGNHVIVPDALSYRETVPKENRYSNEKEIPDMLEEFMKKDLPSYPELDSWATAIKSMMYFLEVHLQNCEANRISLEKAEQALQEEAERKKRERKEKREASKKEG